MLCFVRWGKGSKEWWRFSWQLSYADLLNFSSIYSSGKEVSAGEEKIIIGLIKNGALRFSRISLCIACERLRVPWCSLSIAVNIVCFSDKLSCKLTYSKSTFYFYFVILLTNVHYDRSVVIGFLKIWWCKDIKAKLSVETQHRDLVLQIFSCPKV